MITPNHLFEEAAFADAEYRKSGDTLAVNARMFEKYSKPMHDWDWRQWGAKRLGPVVGCDVLDYGCGQGEETIYLALMGARVTAIDISSVGIEYTRQRAKLAGVNVDVRQMRCDPTDFTDASFDVVHGFGILHHVGLEIGLKETRRLLRQGGRALFFEHMGNIDVWERLKKTGSGAARYTNRERPLRWNEVAAHQEGWSRFEVKAFHVSARIRKRIRLFGRDAFLRLDDTLLKAIPGLVTYASGMVIVLQK